MNKDTLLTVFAVGFAAFAAWWVARPAVASPLGIAATNYTPAFDALVNRNPVNAPPPVQIKTDELGFWHEKEPGW